jgi:hypothetical protein
VLAATKSTKDDVRLECEGSLWGRPVWARWRRGAIDGDEQLLDVAELGGWEPAGAPDEFLEGVVPWLDPGSARLVQSAG